MVGGKLPIKIWVWSAIGILNMNYLIKIKFSISVRNGIVYNHVSRWNFIFSIAAYHNGSEKCKNYLQHMVSGRVFVEQVSLVFRYNYFITRRVQPQTQGSNIFGNQWRIAHFVHMMYFLLLNSLHINKSVPPIH